MAVTVVVSPSSRSVTSLIGPDDRDHVTPQMFGDAGEASTDSLPAITDALAYLARANGGTLHFPAGTYDLLSVEAADSMSWQIAIPCDNVTLDFHPAAVIRSSIAARVIVALGNAKAAGQAAWATHETTDATLYNLTGTQAKGADRVQLATPAQAANFAVGDVAYIRTGQTLSTGNGQPDAELNEVRSVDAATGIITLRWPLTKSYRQEHYNSGSSGISSVGGGGSAAPFGIAKVTDRVLRNFALVNPRIEHVVAGSSFAQTISVWGCIGFRMTGGNVTYSSNAVGSRDTRFAEVTGARLEHRDDGANGYSFAPSTGCTNWNLHHNEIISDGSTYLHIHEGVAASKFSFNTLQLGNCPTADDMTAIGVRARAHDLDISHNDITVNGPSEGNGIMIDELSPGGITLSYNTVFATNGAANIRIDSPNVRGAHTNSVSNGRISLRAFVTGTGAQTGVQVLTGCVTKDVQTCELGTLPRNAYVIAARCFVSTAFNSDGTDNITIGTDADPDAYGTAVDASSGGVKAPGAGVEALKPAEGGAVTIKAFYANGGAEPTSGAAIVSVEYALASRSN